MARTSLKAQAPGGPDTSPALFVRSLQFAFFAALRAPGAIPDGSSRKIGAAHSPQMPSSGPTPQPDLGLTQVEIQAAQGGDGQALDNLFARYMPRVRAMVAARIGRLQRDCGDLDDLVQETFKDAVVGLQQLDHESEGMFVHWLSRCIENNVRDQLRRDRALKRGAGKVRPMAALRTTQLSESLFAGNESPPSQIARGKEAEEQIEAAMLTLGPRYREVIALRVHGELSYKEIAKAMNLSSENTANVLFLRARARLAEVLEGE